MDLVSVPDVASASRQEPSRGQLKVPKFKVNWQTVNSTSVLTVEVIRQNDLKIQIFGGAFL